MCRAGRDARGAHCADGRAFRSRPLRPRADRSRADRSLAACAQGPWRRVQSAGALRNHPAPRRGRRLAARPAGRGSAAPADRGDGRTRAQRDHPQRFAGHRFRPGDESLPWLRARLRVLLRAAVAQLSESVAGAGFRNQAARQEQLRRGAARGTGQARLRAQADQYRQQHRRLSTDREALAADACRTRGAGIRSPSSPRTR